MHESPTYRIKIGVIMSSIVGLLILGYFISTQSVKQRIDPQIVIRQQKSSSPVTAIDSASPTIQASGETRVTLRTDPKKIVTLEHQPIDVSMFRPVAVPESMYEKLGLLKTDSGEVIYFHGSHKIGFPMAGFVRSMNYNKQDPMHEVLGKRDFRVEYVTDSRGRLLMHYEIMKIKNGQSTTLRTFDRNLSKEISSLRYIPIHSIILDEQGMDSVTGVAKFRSRVRFGIFTWDTTYSARKIDVDPNLFIESRTSELHVKDSLLKSSFGGEAGLARDFAFDLNTAKGELADIVRRKFAKIKNEGLDRVQELTAKMEFARDLMDERTKIEDKLRLEQLGRKLDYDRYVAQHEKEAVDLTNASDLIPITIRSAMKLRDDGKFDDGVIFWYRKSPEVDLVLASTIANRSSASGDQGLGIALSPNPAMMYLYLDYDKAGSSSMTLTLVDLTGKSLYTESWQPSGNAGRKEVSVLPYPPGIYLVVVDSERGRTTRQVVIKR